MPKAFRTSLASAGVASVTTRPFSTSYEFAPTFMVIEDGTAYGERDEDFYPSFNHRVSARIGRHAVRGAARERV